MDDNENPAGISGKAAATKRVMPKGRPFVKGQSGNPAGRSKQKINWLESLDSFFDSPHPHAEKINEKFGLTGEFKVKTHLDVMRWKLANEDPQFLIEQRFGRAVQALEHSGPEGQPITILEHAHRFVPNETAK